MSNVWAYFLDHRAEVTHWSLTTLWLATVPLVAGLVASIPLGWLASRSARTYTPIVSTAAVFYTIPSLVMLIVLPGLIGTRILDTINVAVALTLYTIALLVRVVADGLRSVPAATRSAAAAVGYTATRQLFSIDLPLAAPVIGAGLRVAAVSNVSLVSVASIIGVPQLGELFVEGNNDNSVTPILVGLIATVILALVLDAVVLGGTRLLTPWRRT